MSALLRHLFLYDRGNLLRVIEESGLSMTQSKALLELGGLGEASRRARRSDLAETLGVSVPSMSRAVDVLVKKRLATRVEDPEDRRVRRVAITARGKKLVDTLIVVRQAGMETFAASLTAAQRRKLDAAIDSLMDRPDIAETYEHLQGGGPLTRYRHLITEDNRKWWTLGAMCFALFMIMLDNTVVNVALPSIQRDLGASISGLEWTINGYTLSFACCWRPAAGSATSSAAAACSSSASSSSPSPRRPPGSRQRRPTSWSAASSRASARR